MITVDDKKISTYTYYYPAKAWKRHSKDLAPIISTNSILDKGLNIHASTSTR